MTTYLGKSCSVCLPRVPFVNCRQFMYLIISLLALRAGYGIWLYQFLIIAYLFTLLIFCSYHSSSHRCGLKPSSGHMWDKPSSVCGRSGVFSQVSPVFAPPYDWLCSVSEIILMGRKIQLKKKKSFTFEQLLLKGYLSLRRTVKAQMSLRICAVSPEPSLFTCTIWAVTWRQNQQTDGAPSEVSDQPGICPVWSESSLSAWRKLGSLATH